MCVECTLIRSRYWQFTKSWVHTWFILFVCEFMEFGTQYIFCNNRNVCLNKTKPSLLAACYGIFSIHYNCIISFYEDSCCQTYSVNQNHYFYVLFCRIIHEMGWQLVFFICCDWNEVKIRHTTIKIKMLNKNVPKSRFYN